MRELNAVALSLVNGKPAHWRVLLLAAFLKEDIEALWQEELSVQGTSPTFRTSEIRASIQPVIESVNELNGVLATALAELTRPTPLRATDDDLVDVVETSAARLLTQYREALDWYNQFRASSVLVQDLEAFATAGDIVRQVIEFFEWIPMHLRDAVAARNEQSGRVFVFKVKFSFSIDSCTSALDQRDERLKRWDSGDS